jgi:hypothetical protein
MLDGAVVHSNPSKKKPSAHLLHLEDTSSPDPDGQTHRCVLTSHDALLKQSESTTHVNLSHTIPENLAVSDDETNMPELDSSEFAEMYEL